MRRRLQALGARRIRLGNAWYWELKPDLKPGEVFNDLAYDLADLL